MKKIVISLILIICSLMVKGQFVGKFDYGSDGRLYLWLQNTTDYTIYIQGSVYSPLRRVGNSETLAVQPHAGLYLGPTTPWRWQWCEGDYYTITYQNGTTQKWVCPINDYKTHTFKAKSLDYPEKNQRTGYWVHEDSRYRCPNSNSNHFLKVKSNPNKCGPYTICDNCQKSLSLHHYK